VPRAGWRHWRHGTLFGPVLDGTVIARDPRDAVSDGAVRDINLWLGSCRDEMPMFLRSTPPAAMIRVTEARIRAQFGDNSWARLLHHYRKTARADESPYEALLSDAMSQRPMQELAQLQSQAGGRVWLSRFDHAPRLEPFLLQGPAHGADNACLWAHLPEFIDRPVLKRAGGPMTLADIEVAARLQRASCALPRAAGPTLQQPSQPSLPTRGDLRSSIVRSASLSSTIPRGTRCGAPWSVSAAIDLISFRRIEGAREIDRRLGRLQPIELRGPVRSLAHLFDRLDQVG
jgi:para-nitrobenzyl esterase